MRLSRTGSVAPVYSEPRAPGEDCVAEDADAGRVHRGGGSARGVRAGSAGGGPAPRRGRIARLRGPGAFTEAAATGVTTEATAAPRGPPRGPPLASRVGTATATGMAEDGAGGAPGSRGGSAPGCSLTSPWWAYPRVYAPVAAPYRRVHVSGGRPVRIPGLHRAAAAAPASASGSGAWSAAAAALVEPACPDARAVVGGHPSRVWPCAAVELRVRHRRGALADPGLPRWPAHDGAGCPTSTRSVCR